MRLFPRPPSLEERVSRELFAARVDRLNAYKELEYYRASVSLAEARIKRLESELQSLLDKDKE